MGIQTSLYSGISGLNTHGTAMTVIGNNIANTNTVGFKTSRTIFSDLLSSAVSGSGGDAQVGRGVGLSTVDNSFSQGTFESTESNTDLAIEGPGFFMVRDALSTELNYTRAGAFRFDESGYLVNAEAYRVQGYALDVNGNPVGDLTDIQVATNTQGFSQASPTTSITLSTNLNSKATATVFDITDPTGTSSYAASLRVYDSLGDTHLITNYFTKTAANTWSVNTVVAGSEIGNAAPLVNVGNTVLTFDTDGTLLAGGTLTTTGGALTWANAANQTQQLAFTLATTQYASDSVVNSQSQDGYAAGTLVSLDIDAAGDIYGKYSNGEPRALAAISLASFGNPGGMLKKGNNLYAETTDSGAPVIGTVGSGVGKLFTNSLEQSNVDLAQEFVKMITIQRGFQANSKIITTTDEMMADLINLKR